MPIQRSVFSAREWACIVYLSDKMEANAKMIGEAIVPNLTSRGRLTVANRVTRRLHDLGCLSHLPDLDAWRLSACGRGTIALHRATVKT